MHALCWRVCTGRPRRCGYGRLYVTQMGAVSRGGFQLGAVVAESALWWRCKVCMWLGCCTPVVRPQTKLSGSPDTSTYTSIAQFYEDLALVFSNCVAYTSAHPDLNVRPWTACGWPCRCRYLQFAIWRRGGVAFACSQASLPDPCVVLRVAGRVIDTPAAAAAAAMARACALVRPRRRREICKSAGSTPPNSCRRFASALGRFPPHPPFAGAVFPRKEVVGRYPQEGRRRGGEGAEEARAKVAAQRSRHVEEGKGAERAAAKPANHHRAAAEAVQDGVATAGDG